MGKSLKIVLINKSDSIGGAAIVTRRLMEALRNEGHDARMLVAEKLSDSPYVEKAASSFTVFFKFALERLRILFSNGFNRETLFKIDTGETGLALWKHPLVKEADAVLLNWVNQGMLSLKGADRLLSLGKPVVWTMHDMWCMTGVCHHAANCKHYEKECGDCPLLGNKKSRGDISSKTWKRKKNLYDNTGSLTFVAVSNWLAGKAGDSSLLKKKKPVVIHNAFDLPGPDSNYVKEQKDEKIRILFGAARLDDPIKGIDVLKEMTAVLKEKYPDISERIEIDLFGGVKNETALDGFYLPVVRLGVLKGESELAQAYISADIVVSASSYETLPGTLVEAQAYGCIPVAFARGGQKDIVDHLHTGYLAEYASDISIAADNLARGVAWAAECLENTMKHSEMIKEMARNVARKFSYHEIANKYLSLIEKWPAT